MKMVDEPNPLNKNVNKSVNKGLGKSPSKSLDFETKLEGAVVNIFEQIYKEQILTVNPPQVGRLDPKADGMNNVGSGPSLPVAAIEKAAKTHWEDQRNKGTVCAIAVSGGRDSMALAMGMQRIGAAVVCLVVNHNLRPEAKSEAEQTLKNLSLYGMRAVVLHWQHEQISTAIEERAREARYELMTDFCNQNNIAHLFVGHNMNDQAETVLMNLARGTGLDGLAGIKPLSQRKGVNIVRPMLGILRREINEFVEQNHVPYFDDPTNDDPSLTRNALRRCLSNIVTDQNLLDRRVANVALFLQEDAQAVKAHVANMAQLYRSLDDNYEIPCQAYAQMNAAERRRLLLECIAQVGQHPDKPRSDNIDRLMGLIENEPAGLYATAGSEIQWDDKSVRIFGPRKT